MTTQLQDAVGALQDVLGMGASTVWAIGEDHAGRVIPAPSKIISSKCPEVVGLGSATTRIQHRRRSLIHEQWPDDVKWKAALAVSRTAALTEVHQAPDNAPSDGPNMLRIEDLTKG